MKILDAKQSRPRVNLTLMKKATPTKLFIPTKYVDKFTKNKMQMKLKLQLKNENI